MNILIESPRAMRTYISDSQWGKLHDLEDQYRIDIRSIDQSDDACRTVVDLDLDLTMSGDICLGEDELAMEDLTAFTYSLVEILDDDASERL